MASFTWNGLPFRADDWTTAADWSGGVVPNAPDADVTLPLITTSSGNAAFYTVAIAAGESISAGSVTLDGAGLSIDGSLSVAGQFIASLGQFGSLEVGLTGRLSVGTLSIGSNQLLIGGGYIASVGTLVVAGQLNPSSGTLDIIITGGTAGFANLNGGTLTGGTYASNGGTLAIAGVGPVVVDAATISFSGLSAATVPAIQVGGANVLATLATIAPSGVLTLDDVTGSAATLTNTIEVDGSVTVENGATLTAPAVSIGASGAIIGSGRATVSAPITGTGTIAAVAGTLSVGSVGGAALQMTQGTLELAGAATGTATFEDSNASVSATAAKANIRRRQRW